MPDKLACCKHRSPCSNTVSALLRAVWPGACVLRKIIDTKGNRMVKLYAMGSLLPTVCALAWQLTHTIRRLSSSKAVGLLLLHRCSHNFVGTNQDFPILARRYGARCWHSCCKSCLAS